MFKAKMVTYKVNFSFPHSFLKFHHNIALQLVIK